MSLSRFPVRRSTVVGRAFPFARGARFAVLADRLNSMSRNGAYLIIGDKHGERTISHHENDVGANECLVAVARNALAGDAPVKDRDAILMWEDVAQPDYWLILTDDELATARVRSANLRRDAPEPPVSGEPDETLPEGGGGLLLNKGGRA